MPSSLKNFKDESARLRVTTLIHSCLTTAAFGSTIILLRDNGRSRCGLPVTRTAPGPSSVRFVVPLSTNRGSLSAFGAPTLPFTAFRNLEYLIL